MMDRVTGLSTQTCSKKRQGVDHFLTSALVYLYLAKYMRQINKTYGLPAAIYSDVRTLFHYDTKQVEEVDMAKQLAGVSFKQPNFKRACQKLGIGLIRAHSAQAKERVERL